MTDLTSPNAITLWNGRSVPRIGIGCWAIGGPMFDGDTPINYGAVDDTAAREGLRLARDLGARLFDTAAAYGGGHSERLLGAALGDDADIVIVTKFGHAVDPDTRRALPVDVTPAGIRKSIDRSRRNLRRDRLDLVLLHVNDLPVAEAGPVFETLDDLRARGIVDAYGWSTDHPDGVRAMAGRDGFVAIEHDFNVFTPAPDLVDLAQRHELLALSRLPLAMGMLTGKFRPGQRLPGDDLRGQQIGWMRFFRDGEPDAEYLKRLEAVRDLLTADGRSLAQGALGWILARSPRALPVPGFKTPEQIRDNLGTLDKGPLPQQAMAEIDGVLAGYAAV